MTRHIIVVDDERRFVPNAAEGRGFATHFTNCDDAQQVLEQLEGTLEELWLDHDLGIWGTIRPLCMWLAERAFNGNPLDVSHIYIHTANYSAAGWMQSTLKQYPTIRAKADSFGLIPADMHDVWPRSVT